MPDPYSLLELRSLLVGHYKNYGTWERIAKYEYNNQVSKALLWKIVFHNHEPKDKHVRHILNMKEYVKVEPCPQCHEAPTVCLCDGKKVVPADMVRSAPPQPPRKLTRCTFYRTTPVDKIIADLERVTGITFEVKGRE